MESLAALIKGFLGLTADNLTVWQMAVRAILVYVIAIVLVRLGEKRFLGKFTALDVILGIMLGSILSRAITNAPDFFATLGSALTLVGMHWFFAMIAFHWDRFGDLVKGRERTLVKGGEIQWDAMRRSHISRKDLEGALRLQANIGEVSEVEEARMERSGDISVIKKDG